MLQPRQDRALSGDTFGQAPIDPFRTRQLQRRSAFHQTVSTLREPHRAHAAFGQQPLELPRTDAIAALFVAHCGQRFGRKARDRGRRMRGTSRKAGGA